MPVKQGSLELLQHPSFQKPPAIDDSRPLGVCLDGWHPSEGTNKSHVPVDCQAPCTRTMVDMRERLTGPVVPRAKSGVSAHGPNRSKAGLPPMKTP